MLKWPAVEVDDPCTGAGQRGSWPALDPQRSAPAACIRIVISTKHAIPGRPGVPEIIGRRPKAWSASIRPADMSTAVGGEPITEAAEGGAAADRAQRELGADGSVLVHEVLILGMTMEQIAQRRGLRTALERLISRGDSAEMPRSAGADRPWICDLSDSGQEHPALSGAAGRPMPDYSNPARRKPSR